MPNDATTSHDTLADKLDKHRAAETAVLSDFGRYEILGEIARGGVGIVYRARQRDLNRIVALKVLQGGTLVSSEHVQRFLHEAQSAAKLQHPNIVPIHDFGSQDGAYFFTMDLVEGESLADRVGRGPLPAREALEIVRQTAEALHYAHEHGVIHRDIKPGNILLDKKGQVKITDFGIAKEVERKDEMHLTVTGQVMGTPRYMSPEQATGQTSKADRRSDVFSLGVTLYEMLTGKPAFEANNVFTVLHKVTNEDPPPAHKLNRKVHRDASTICQKAMEKAPDNRYQSGEEMAEDIERFLAGEPIEARPVSGIARAGRKLRKHWKLILINAVLVCGVGYLVKYYADYYQASRPSHLRLQLQPTNVNVAVDGIDLSDEALAGNFQLKPGKHRLQAALEPTYEPQEIEFETRPAERITLPVSLERRRGRVEITTDPPDAAVTIITPKGERLPFRGPRVEQELATGHYIALVHRENHLAQRLEINVGNRQTQTLRSVLPPITIWGVPTSGNVLSVPAVADLDSDGWGDVVVGGDDGKIYCLSGKNGGVLWLFSAQDAVQAPIGLADMNNDGTPDVLAGSVDRRLYCLNGKDGKLLWSFETQGPILGPPRLKDINDDGVLDVFVGSADGYVYAVSGADGKQLWKFRTNGRVESALAWQRVDGGHVLLAGSADKSLYALDPRTGQLLWKVETVSPLLFPIRLEDPERSGRIIALLPTPQSADDMLTHTAVSLAERKVIGVSDAFPLLLDMAGDGKLMKLQVSPRGTECYAADGTNLLWRSEYPAVAPHGADVNGDGWLDLIFNNGPDEIICLNGKDGTALGRIKLDTAVGRGYSLEDVDRDGVPDVTVGAGRRVYCFSWVGGRQKWLAKSDTYYDAPLAQVNGKLIAKNQGGQIAAYISDSAQPLWKLSTSPQAPAYAGVAAGQGMVLDADAHTRTLRAVAADTGAPLWQAKLPGNPDAPIGSPVIANGFVVIGDADNGVHCLASTNGAIRWSAAVPKVFGAAATGKDFACVADVEGALRCLSLADGKERWQFRAPVTGGSWSSQPTLVDINGDNIEDVIAVNDDGQTYAVNGRDGQTLWLFPHAKNRQRTRNRVVLTGPKTGILATADGDVFCLDLAQGKALWSIPLHESMQSEPTLADLNGDSVPDILVGTMKRRLHCLDGRTGASLWSCEVGGQIRYTTPQVLANKLVFIATGPPENALYCLRGDCVRENARAWFGPWRSLSLTK